MNLASEVYQQLSARRNALMLTYKHNDSLKNNDPAAYQQYQGELRNLNRQLRLIRQQIERNPMF